MLLTAFEKEFGKEIIYSPGQIEITIPVVEKIIGILNVFLFNKKLFKIQIEFCKDLNALNDLTKHFYNVEELDKEDEKIDKYAAYLPDFDLGRVKQTGEIVAKFNKELVAFNIEKQFNFMLLASTICHEMIHRYDAFFGEGKIMMYWKKLHHKVDMHTTPTFIKLMKLANEEGLKVKPTTEEMSCQQLNKEALDFSKMLEESGSPKKVKLVKHFSDNIEIIETNSVCLADFY